ncbi:unnamed protein product [Cuscuta europaea]|uniref:Uncharacterized protein n=1 Tax=Cuscuta europaea TaxID=41803 RepID=A0A9P0VMJ5_CUSEU|nr:unnamed protein product [Cuscuta europaea]
MSTITPVHNQFLAPFTAISILNRTSSTSVCCFCARHGGHRGGSRWESKARSNQQRFRFEEDFLANGGQRDADFGFGKAVKQRSWWSDDEPFGGNGFEDDDEDEDEDFGGFGAKEGSIGVSWIFKEERRPTSVKDKKHPPEQRKRSSSSHMLLEILE